jgi:olefin beta-lactone synthetase
MNVSELFFQMARQSPDAIAIADKGKSLIFNTLEQKVRAQAAHFRAKGLRPGDRVLVFVPMSVELYCTVLALFQIGATAVFLDEWVSLSRLRLCCRLADCRGFVAPWKFRLLGFFIPEIRKIPLHFGLQPPENEALGEIFPAKSDDPALLTFTTGSTGTPKVARRTHGFLRQQFDALIEEMQPRAGDVVMTNLPIVLLVNFGTGATSVIARFNSKKPQAFKPSEVLATIKQLNVNVLICSPHPALRLAEAALYQSKTPLRKIFTGGGPVFPAEAAQLAEAFPQAEIRVVYGSTEAEPIASIVAENLLLESDLMGLGGLCVGEPFHRISLKIIEIREGDLASEDLEKLELPPGEIGEIVVAGGHVLREYWNNEAAFRRNKIVDAAGRVWHRTGDAGFVGAAGRLYLTGRCDQMIRRAGGWISPFLVEDLLRQMPGAAAGTVLESGGQLTVFVEPIADAKQSDLEKTLRARLPFPIDNVVVMKKIPRDPRHFSKIDYARLRAATPSLAR